MRVKFTKMQGAGNDFVVLDAINQAVNLTTEQVRLLADRHFGIGFDQLLLVEKPLLAEADFRYRIFNADGGEVEQCGNGARCFVRFVLDHGMTSKHEITVETKSGLITPRLESDGRVTVNMGPPRFIPAEIPFQVERQALTYMLDVDGASVEISALSMGNPHAVQIVDNVDLAPVGLQGPRIESHPRFPDRVNAGFMQILNGGRVRLRVYERGAGETLSCGTGACAAAVAGITRGLLDCRVDVETRGGVLTIEWLGDNSAVMMSGPAARVFDGELEILSAEVMKGEQEIMEKILMTKTTGLAVLLAGVEALRRDLDDEVPAQTIACFCQIAMRGEMPMYDLIDLMGVSNAAVSRNITKLGNGSPREPGLKLVEAYEDPEWRRRKLVKLTAKGIKVADKAVAQMNSKAFAKGGAS